MGMFWKSRGRDHGPADDALTFFSRDQADEFRALVGATLGERGLAVQMKPDHARLASTLSTCSAASRGHSGRRASTHWAARR